MIFKLPVLGHSWISVTKAASECQHFQIPLSSEELYVVYYQIEKKVFNNLLMHNLYIHIYIYIYIYIHVFRKCLIKIPKTTEKPLQWSDTYIFMEHLEEMINQNAVKKDLINIKCKFNILSAYFYVASIKERTCLYFWFCSKRYFILICRTKEYIKY